MNKYLKPALVIVPLAIFIALFFFLWRGLYMQPEVLPSALIGKPVPNFHLTNLMSPAYPFTEQNLKGQVLLLNVWASWCSACEMEHAMLLKIKNQYSIPIYGIDYKDNPRSSKRYLAAMGNPYEMIGDDTTGDVAMDLGVYGTPETFIVDKKGTIIYRHIGVIDDQVWESEMLPLIKALE